MNWLAFALSAIPVVLLLLLVKHLAGRYHESRHLRLLGRGYRAETTNGRTTYVRGPRAGGPEPPRFTEQRRDGRVLDRARSQLYPLEDEELADIRKL